MSNKERFEWMRKRQSFLNDIVRSYTSLAELVKDKDEWFALRGIDLTKEDDKCASICIWLDYGEYDVYFVIPDKNGHLTISEIVLWQDNYCANTFVNPFEATDNNPHAGFAVDEEDILTAIHDYS